MAKDILDIEKPSKKIASSTSFSKALINQKIRFEGQYLDITESYYWFFNFAYYVGKGYTTSKLEDYHYFSENSQFGGNIRQVKGGSIQAFQNNFQQLIQLVKIHLFPLLKEVKQADFYNEWISKIVDFDAKIQEELKKSKNNQNQKDLKFWKGERDEAINHLKDKWVMEVDGGRLWQMNRSSTEQGLDYALLPQLFFGTNLQNPLYELNKTGKTIKEQLDEDIYSIDISEGAKEQTARFMFRFYTWLPGAIKETQTTFRLKLSALKQFYSQIQMHINFLKPLLIEINKKSERMEETSFYNGFESESPDIVNLFDSSYSFVRTIGVRGYERGGLKLSDLEFTDFGLFIPATLNGGKTNMILKGANSGKSGFIKGEASVCDSCSSEGSKKCKNCGSTSFTKKYIFFSSDKKDIDPEEFSKLKKSYCKFDDLFLFPVMELIFSQKRRGEIEMGQQGPQQVPYMKNEIGLNGYAWNIFEVASYREKMKADNLDLLESFIEEVAVMKEDLLHYVKGPTVNNVSNAEDSSKFKKEKKKADNTIIFGPIAGIYEIFKPLIPSFKFPSKSESSSDEGEHESQKIAKLSILEDTWKLYTVYKKTHGYMQF